MSKIDYAELFKSPLDEPGEPGNRWGPLAGGVIVGVLFVSLLAAVTTSDDPETVPSTIARSVTNAPAAAPFLEYPPGFTEISSGVAAQPIELIRGADSILVAFHTAAQRDSNPADIARPIGGTWWLETADGGGVESSRVVLGRFSPGAFAVEFPRPAGSGEVTAIRMIERWDVQTEVGAEQISFDGEPYAMPEPSTIPVTQQTTLIVEELELGRFLGKVAWRIEGGVEPKGPVLIEVTLLNEAGGEVGTFGAFPEIIDPAASGITEILWQEPYPQDQEGAVIAEIRYSVGLVKVVATDVGFDLQGVPEGR